MHLLVLALKLSLDSFIAGCALGPLGLPRASRGRLALAFGACDALATLVSGRIGLSVAAAGQAGPVLMAAYGACVLLLGRLALWERRLIRALPLLLCLDNLATPAAPALAPLLGVASAGMALAGFGAAASGARFFATRPRACGVALICGSGLLLLS